MMRAGVEKNPGWMRKMMLRLLGLIYRVEVCGLESLPEEGGVLMLSNHVSYVDAIILQMATPRTIRFLSYEGFFKVPLLGTVLRAFRVIPISPRHAKEAVVKAAEALKRGEVVCIFPEGKLT
ncbi:MAG: hypothetical protein HC904_13795 [Blastochloris sp.]|nr:hypothetical protein [Blastochloris sp.]